MEELPRWPKGPFPERYRFERVQARMADAWSDAARTAFVQETSWEELEAGHDPWLRLFRAELPAEEAQRVRARARACGVTLFEHIPPGKTRFARDGTMREWPRTLGLAPTADIVDAISVVGVSGPHYGIGLAAIVRFAATLRTIVEVELTQAGEDHVTFALEGLEGHAALRIATRALDLCLPLRERHGDAAGLADAITTQRALAFDWPPR